MKQQERGNLLNEGFTEFSGGFLARAIYTEEERADIPQERRNSFVEQIMLGQDISLDQARSWYKKLVNKEINWETEPSTRNVVRESAQRKKSTRPSHNSSGTNRQAEKSSTPTSAESAEPLREPFIEESPRESPATESVGVENEPTQEQIDTFYTQHLDLLDPDAESVFQQYKDVVDDSAVSAEDLELRTRGIDNRLNFMIEFREFLIARGVSETDYTDEQIEQDFEYTIKLRRESGAVNPQTATTEEQPATPLQEEISEPAQSELEVDKTDAPQEKGLPKNPSQEPRAVPPTKTLPRQESVLNTPSPDVNVVHGLFAQVNQTTGFELKQALEGRIRNSALVQKAFQESSLTKEEMVVLDRYFLQAIRNSKAIPDKDRPLFEKALANKRIFIATLRSEGITEPYEISRIYELVANQRPKKAKQQDAAETNPNHINPISVASAEQPAPVAKTKIPPQETDARLAEKLTALIEHFKKTPNQEEKINSALGITRNVLIKNALQNAALTREELSRFKKYQASEESLSDEEGKEYAKLGFKERSFRDALIVVGVSLENVYIIQDLIVNGTASAQYEAKTQHTNNVAAPHEVQSQQTPTKEIETPTLNEAEPQQKLTPEEALARYEKATTELFPLIEMVNNLFKKDSLEQSAEYKKADEVLKTARKKHERIWAEYYFASGGKYIPDDGNKDAQDYYQNSKVFSREHPDLAEKYEAKVSKEAEVLQILMREFGVEGGPKNLLELADSVVNNGFVRKALEKADVTGEDFFQMDLLTGNDPASPQGQEYARLAEKQERFIEILTTAITESQAFLVRKLIDYKVKRIDEQKREAVRQEAERAMLEQFPNCKVSLEEMQRVAADREQLEGKYEAAHIRAHELYQKNAGRKDQSESYRTAVKLRQELREKLRRAQAEEYFALGGEYIANNTNPKDKDYDGFPKFFSRTYSDVAEKYRAKPRARGAAY